MLIFGVLQPCLNVIYNQQNKNWVFSTWTVLTFKCKVYYLIRTRFCMKVCQCEFAVRLTLYSIDYFKKCNIYIHKYKFINANFPRFLCETVG